MGHIRHNEKKQYSHYESRKLRERDRKYIQSNNDPKLPKPGQRNGPQDSGGSKDPK